MKSWMLVLVAGGAIAWAGVAGAVADEPAPAESGEDAGREEVAPLEDAEHAVPASLDDVEEAQPVPLQVFDDVPASAPPAAVPGTGSAEPGPDPEHAPERETGDAAEVAIEDVIREAAASMPTGENVVASSFDEVLPQGPGPVGYDAAGRPGRIHVVVPGDTLWHISDAYLGTPWVWPSVWTDNEDIENPHLIYPGDRIWITRTEMRRVSPEEAEALLAGTPAAGDPLEPEAPPAAEEPLELPAEVAGTATAEEQRLRVIRRETSGLISSEALSGAASIVGSTEEQTLLAQEDQVYIGLGEGEAERGDQFTVFRVQERVVDPDTGRALGYHVDFLGWVEVEQSFPETSLARVRHSAGDIEVGDRLLQREPLSPEIAIQPSPAVEGKISFFPQSRVVIGQIDYVYLNRGSLDGLEVGSPLEVYRPGRFARERARDERVQIPDHVIARLVVVRTQPESSVALVTNASTELGLGDRFRGSGHTN